MLWICYTITENNCYLGTEHPTLTHLQCVFNWNQVIKSSSESELANLYQMFCKMSCSETCPLRAIEYEFSFNIAWNVNFLIIKIQKSVIPIQIWMWWLNLSFPNFGKLFRTPKGSQKCCDHDFTTLFFSIQSYYTLLPPMRLRLVDFLYSNRTRRRCLMCSSCRSTCFFPCFANDWIKHYYLTHPFHFLGTNAQFSHRKYKFLLLLICVRWQLCVAIGYYY